MSKKRLAGIYLDTDKPAEKEIYDFVSNHILKPSDLIKLALSEFISNNKTIKLNYVPSEENNIIKIDNSNLDSNSIGNEIDI